MTKIRNKFGTFEFRILELFELIPTGCFARISCFGFICCTMIYSTILPATSSCLQQPFQGWRDFIGPVHHMDPCILQVLDLILRRPLASLHDTAGMGEPHSFRSPCPGNIDHKRLGELFRLTASAASSSFVPPISPKMATALVSASPGRGAGCPQKTAPPRALFRHERPWSSRGLPL